MSNNVRYLRSTREELPKVSGEPEPTPLQRAVLMRARELRERQSVRRKRSPAQWATAAVLAVVCFGLMYGAVDVVLRKMQRLAEDFSMQPAAVPAEPEPAPAPQSQSPDQPYFIDVHQSAATDDPKQ
jgi:hypothetical protein